MQRRLRIAPLFAAAILVAACGSSDSYESTESSAAAVSRAPVGAPVHPNFPTVTACPAGDACAVSAVNLSPPFDGCSTPSWFTESGATTAAYAVSLCPTGAALTAWLASFSPTVVATTNSVPYFAAATAGYTYVTLQVPTPGLMPVSPTCTANDSCPTAEGIVWTTPSGNALPCSQVYSVPSSHPGGMWASLCVETPAVDAWVTDFASTFELHAGEVTLPSDVAFAASYGYVYLAWWSNADVVIIGNGCSSSCIHL